MQKAEIQRHTGNPHVDIHKAARLSHWQTFLLRAGFLIISAGQSMPTVALAEPQRGSPRSNNPSVCTDFGGNQFWIGTVSPDGQYTCLGTAETVRETRASIMRQNGESRSEHALVIAEHDSQGTRIGRSSIQLTYPNFALPQRLMFADAHGNTLACELAPESNLYGACATISIVNGPPPTGTPYPIRTQTPTTTPPPSATPTIVPTQIPTTVVDSPAPKALSPPASCTDSWGNTGIPLGEDRPDNDDCISISPDVPQQGYITYTFQTEPQGPQNERAIIEVVVKPDGSIYWNFAQANLSHQPQRREFSVPIPAFIHGLLAFLRGDSQPPQDIAQASFAGYPAIDQIPKDVVSARVLQWYNLVKEVSMKMNYDPRTHLVFISNESDGNPRARSNQGKDPELQAEGLVQIIPGTWTLIRNTIKESPGLMRIAQELKVDPDAADPKNPKDNIFFSSIYLIYYCRLPLGKIPDGAGFSDYLEGVVYAGKRYHDGHNSDRQQPSPNGKIYMAKIRALLPKIRHIVIPTPAAEAARAQ